MYSPTRWPGLAQELYDIDIFLRSQNTTQRAKRSTISKSSVLKDRQSEAASDYSFQAVTCADAIDAGNVTTKDVFDFLVKVTQEPLLFVLSGIVGPTWGDAGFYCHHWPVRAVERYTGPWNKTLSNPILVIGNEADPITPYISAKRVADALGDSAILLEQDDYGHVSLAMHSSCTTDVLKKYFLDNELPPRDNLLCGTNQQLFPGPGITKNTLAALSAPGYGSGNNTDLNAELEAARQRSRNLLITVIVQAAALVLVILGLTFSWVRNRKSKSGHATYIPRGVFEKAAEGQGHTYDNPFNPITSSEKGGYSRVET
ncbi:hypothetical protein FRC07_009551 [Ceratobasidium sp. 392]|nr:hypothetical protein FRC07_009551 [Ceratobasidium sp. 392]